MNTLTNNQLYEVKGGAVKWGVVFAISGALSFLVGLVDGLINPAKCNR